ncbi:MAG TPA: MobF family relaxase [Pyrinomonadaceae bacterium]|nr:MobF family relaxase [Pyrinomonadaceae bacterium]
MLTISRAISAGQASNYYKQEFTNSQDNYYREAGEVPGRWCGTLAEEWNLKGEVTTEQYERLVAGQDPHTGEQLIRVVSARETVNKFGDEITTNEHRAAWDLTISAPKSASLALLVGKDGRVLDAHLESGAEAVKAVEKYLQARGGGDKPAITTGKMIAAQFVHTSSRPDHETGYAAPQLHTHVVFFNMTQCEDGKVRSVDPLELYRSQQYGTAVYRAHFAEKLQALGYEIRVDPRTGAPEIEGFSEAYLQDSSPRRKEVLKEEEKMRGRMESEGKTVSDNARLKQAAARNNRRSKNFDHGKMQERALEMDARHGYQARRIVAQARARLPLRLPQNEIEIRAQEAVTFARDNALKTEAVADMRTVWKDALRRNLGLTNPTAVAAELQRRQESGELKPINPPQRQPQTTTERMAAMEKENIQTMLDGKESRPAMVEAERVNEVVTAIAESQQRTLNTKQRSAIAQILSSKDQIIGLQGGAGTGKTTALSVLREAAEKEGYQVRGFAPSARAAQQLAESGIQTETLQMFVRRRKQPATQIRLIVLDESSLASTKHIHKLLRLLEPEDKVVCVGDVRQHQAVEAGSPFQQLQEHGMTTAALTEIVRQPDEEQKKIVENLAARNTPEAVAELISRGKVIEIADERERLEAMAQDYAKNPTSKLVISPANRERKELNSLIHRELQREGIVSRNDQQTTVYVSRPDMTGPERTFANSYRPNEDIIRYNSPSEKFQVKAGDYARVIETDHATNRITVQFFDGRELAYNPTRLSGVSVYYEAERTFAAGDRLQIRAPFREKRIANGELGTITKIEPDQVRLAMDSGREISIDLRKFRHLDYGYAVTSHSAQGLTFDRVLVNADTQESARLLNDRTAYVAISRARYDALIYTNSKQNLSEALNRRVDKETALGAIQDDERERKDREKVIKEPPAPQQPLLPFDHSLDQRLTYPEPAQTQAAPLAAEIPLEIASARYEPAISSESAQSLQKALDRGLNHATPLETTQEANKDPDKLSHDSFASQQQQPPLEQTPTHADPAQTKAEVEIEAPEIDLGDLIL